MFRETWTLKPSKNHASDYKGESGVTEKIWKPLGRLPSWSRNALNAYSYSNKINRYLMYQENRIMKAMLLKQYSKVTILWLIMLKNSYGYQLVLFNKVMPQWHYLLSYEEAQLQLQKVVNKCRSNDLWLDLKRFYILKADGKRWRPIGAPDYPSRVISRSLNDLIYVLFEDKFNKVQHGFRKNRGAFTAIIEIVNKLKKSPKFIYEFDLKSYFNTVRPMWVYRSLLSRSPLLAEVIYKIIMQIRYKLPSERVTGEEVKYNNKYVYMVLSLPIIQIVIIYYLGVTGLVAWGVITMFVLELGFDRTVKGDYEPNLKYINSWSTWKDERFNIIRPERELRCNRTEPLEVKIKGKSQWIDAPYIIREGLPQGLSISPVLATLTMEMFKNPEELTLYADDGVYIGNDMSKFNKWKQDVSLVGAELAESKSKFVRDEFTFLGCLIDIKGQRIQAMGKTVSWWDPEFEKKVKTMYVEEPYKKKEGWNWDIKSKSVTALNYTDFIDLYNFPMWDVIKIWWNNIMYGLPHKGYRMFKNNTIIDILGASSFACNELAKRKAGLNLVAIKPLSAIFSGKLSNYCMVKGQYYEEIYENNLRHYIDSKLPGWNNVLENYWEESEPRYQKITAQELWNSMGGIGQTSEYVNRTIKKALELRGENEKIKEEPFKSYWIGDTLVGPNYTITPEERATPEEEKAWNDLFGENADNSYKGK